MHFKISGEIVTFFDNNAGNHATMFGPGGRRLAFRGDLCSWNNEKREYTWAFEYSGDPLRPGDRLVFATVGHGVAGEVGADGSITVSAEGPRINRASDGKPLTLAIPLNLPAETPRVSLGAKLPKVSVLTCSYNRPDYLRVAIDSLRTQTDQDWEHLIYDDASPDERVSEVLAWAERDPRVRVFRGTVNQNRPAKLWNFLADRALGRYFTVLDDDNEKLPHFIEKMSGRLEVDPSLGFVTCAWLHQRREGASDEEIFSNMATAPVALGDYSTCDGGAIMFRREAFAAVGYYNEAQRTNEDWDWLRRATYACKYENLKDILCTYRSHETNRMLVAQALGSDEDALAVRSRSVFHSHVGVRFISPDPSRLTASQRDAVRSISRGLGTLPWVTSGEDVAVVVAPFQMTPDEVKAAVSGCTRAVSLHMEDPYALGANLERVRAMAGTGVETWVATNDIAAKPHYESVVGDRVLVCPSLGADGTLPRSMIKRDIDVLLCGYAYPSRKRFVADLLPRIRYEAKVTVMGDGWSGLGVRTLPTQDLEHAHEAHLRSKAVVCLHRTNGDCVDGPAQPRTLNRGFVEGYAGARVFVDKSRDHHDLVRDDAVFYDGPEDLAVKLLAYLAGGETASAERFSGKCARLYTAGTRIGRVIQSVVGGRRGAEIP